MMFSFRTDLFIPIIISSSVLGALSIIATYVLSGREIQNLLPQKRDVPQETSIITRALLFSCVFAVFAIPFLYPRQETRVTFNITQICGRDLNAVQVEVGAFSD